MLTLILKRKGYICVMHMRAKCHKRKLLKQLISHSQTLRIPLLLPSRNQILRRSRNIDLQGPIPLHGRLGM